MVNMMYPNQYMTAVQANCLRGWFNAIQQTTAYWQHCFAFQAKFLHSDVRRIGAEPTHGASLTDGYGKRSHDIDPERDV